MINKIILSLIIFSELFVVYPQTDQWIISGEMPFPVADGELVFNQTAMYLLGGYSEDSQSAQNKIYRFNFTNNVWTEISTMVLSRQGFVSIAYNRELFSFGGISDNMQNSNSLEVSNLTRPSEIIYNNNYFRRINSAGVTNGSELFVVGGNPSGGFTNTALPYLFKFNLVQPQLTILENQIFAGRKLPEQQMVATHDQNIYIFGGLINGISREIFKYDVETNQLTVLDIKLNEPRAGGRAIHLADGNHIFILGGYNETNKALETMEVFQILGDTYRIWKGPNLNVARKNFMISQYLNKIYVMGGYDKDGNVVSSIETFEPELTDLDDIPKLPEDTELFQNYPNPFNPSTEIRFSISRETKLSLTIYSMTGEQIKTLAAGNYSSGNYSYIWDGRNNRNEIVPSGVYIYSLATDNKKYSKKMIFLK